MVNSQEPPWSNNPNAPKIPYSVYLEEKATLAGSLTSSILYGMTTYTSAYPRSLYLPG